MLDKKTNLLIIGLIILTGSIFTFTIYFIIQIYSMNYVNIQNISKNELKNISIFYVTDHGNRCKIIYENGSIRRIENKETCKYIINNMSN